jgi:hypothetical protein
MSEFFDEIAGRMASAEQSLALARQEGDDYSEGIFQGEIESLRRLAEENGVPAPGGEPDTGDQGPVGRVA